MFVLRVYGNGSGFMLRKYFTDNKKSDSNIDNFYGVFKN